MGFSRGRPPGVVAPKGPAVAASLFPSIFIHPFRSLYGSEGNAANLCRRQGDGRDRSYPSEKVRGTPIIRLFSDIASILPGLSRLDHLWLRGGN